MFRLGTARLLVLTAIGCLLLALGLRAGGIDRPLFLAVNEAAWRWAPPAALSCITILGHGLSATMLLSPALLRAPPVWIAGLYATPLALLLSRLPKTLIDSPRPAAVLDPAGLHIVGMRLAAHNSFPSGHAITAFLVVAVLLAGNPAARPRIAARFAVVLLGIAVAVSRVAVGAHWPSDALAGTALGLLAGVAGAQAASRWRPAWGPAAQIGSALALFACSIVLARADLGYPMALPLQWVLAALGVAVAAATLWRAWAARSAAARLPG